MTFSRAVAVLIFIITLISPVPASGASLPEKIEDWRLSSEHVTELKASQDMGKWMSASYVRSTPPARIEVQLTEGSGPLGLYVPEGIVSSDDGPIGFSSTYETLTVAGRPAILEQNTVTGQALAVALGARLTVTFESMGISRKEMLDFAGKMIEALQ